jgi:anaerobic selenocysteine-containing dehydrogenase
VRGSFVQIEARMTPTGGSADEWIPVPPGTEGILALALAHVILRDELGIVPSPTAAGLIEGWARGLPDYSPERVARLTNVAAERIERLARAFAERRPSAAIIGGPPLAHTNALPAALAVNALNALVGSVGQPGGLCFMPQVPRHTPRHRTSLEAVAKDILSGNQRVEALLVDQVNPLFTTPPGWRAGEAFERVPFVVSFSSFVDETSASADLILPDHSSLESWVEAVPESGANVAVASVGPPVMRPLFQTRATPDVLLEVARTLARPLDLPWRTFEEMLKETFNALGPEAWTTAEKQSGWWGDLPPAINKAAAMVLRLKSTRTFALSAPLYDGDASDYPFHFLPYRSLAFGDGSLAHLPWLQELPDPMTSAMWTTLIEINPRTAERFGIRLGDIVEVASTVGSIHAPAFLSPGIAPDVIAVPVGQGHRTFTRYASERGANPISILSPMRTSDVDAFAWAATRVKLRRLGGPDRRLILFSSEAVLREHPYLEGPR